MISEAGLVVTLKPNLSQGGNLISLNPNIYCDEVSFFSGESQVKETKVLFLFSSPLKKKRKSKTSTAAFIENDINIQNCNNIKCTIIKTRVWPVCFTYKWQWLHSFYKQITCLMDTSGTDGNQSLLRSAYLSGLR